MNILLLEDDLSLGATLRDRLQKTEYTTDWAKSIAQARELVSTNHYNLFVLDIGLPDGSGFDFAEELVRESNSPFLFMTAQNSAEDRLRGFEIGAVEYIPKPFHLKEFLIRVEQAIKIHAIDQFKIADDFYVDFLSLTIRAGAEEKVMNPKEAGVLSLLIKNSPKVLSRDQLLNKVWGEDNYPSNRTVDNVIVSLRQLLGKHSGRIGSARGVGYFFK